MYLWALTRLVCTHVFVNEADFEFVWECFHEKK